MAKLNTLLIAFIMAGIWVVACSEEQGDAPVDDSPFDLAGMSAVMILPAFPDSTERSVTARELKNAGVALVAASLTRAASPSGDPGPSLAVPINEVDATAHDAYVFIGGLGIQDLETDEPTRQLARGAVENQKLVAAICAAPRVLAAAGVLKGKQATCYPTSRKFLESKGAIVVSSPVVIDAPIITADSPDSADAFAEAILTYLSEL